MLRSLHIENYVLIDSLDASFPEGLVIITGQTGAGKSILLGALGLLLGAKADASVISAGADSCIVEGEFEVSDQDVRGSLEEAGVEWENGSLTVRRVVYSTGRSRTFINDCPVQVGVLSDISARLVDIHSQHQSLLLTNRRFQLSLLDFYAGVDSKGLAAQWQRIRETEAELESVSGQLRRLEADREYNQAQWDQLSAAKLEPDELESLELEQKQLANAQEIKASLGEVCACFASEGEGMSSDICASLKEAARLLEKTSRFIPSLSELASRVESSRIELEDIKAEVESSDSSVVVSGERLSEVEERLALIYRLFQKHGCRTISELLEVQAGFENALFDSDSLERRKDALEKELSSLRKTFDDMCGKAHSSREAAAARFASSIQDSIRYLELDRAVFSVSVSPCAPGPSGTDSVSYLFSSTGENPVDVSKCASGGEISRIMLCLKAMMARYCAMPTMVFDEIDTGVSGSTADKMGEMICGIGKDRQVFVITHLPQVAAKGSAHYLVEKAENPEGHVSSSVRALDPDARVMEIARLLSGSTITPAAIANAKALLSA